MEWDGLVCHRWHAATVGLDAEFHCKFKFSIKKKKKKPK